MLRSHSTPRPAPAPVTGKRIISQNKQQNTSKNVVKERFIYIPLVSVFFQNGTLNDLRFMSFPTLLKHPILLPDHHAAPRDVHSDMAQLLRSSERSIDRDADIK